MGRRDRASIKILEVLAREGRPLTWKELVEKTGLAKATVTHGLKRLRRSDLVKPQLMEGEKIAWSLNRDDFLEALSKFLEGRNVPLESMHFIPGELTSGRLGLRYDMLSDLIPEKLLERRERLRAVLSAIIDKEIFRLAILESLKEEPSEEELAKLAGQAASNISRSIGKVFEKMLFDVMKEAEAKVQEEMKKRGDEVEHYSGRLWRKSRRPLYL